MTKRPFLTDRSDDDLGAPIVSITEKIAQCDDRIHQIWQIKQAVRSVLDVNSLGEVNIPEFDQEEIKRFIEFFELGMQYMEDDYLIDEDRTLRYTFNVYDSHNTLVAAVLRVSEKEVTLNTYDIDTSVLEDDYSSHTSSSFEPVGDPDEV
jgi:hypothetical protein